MPPQDRDEIKGDARSTGEYVDLDPESSDVEEQEDGSAYVVLDDETVNDQLGDFFSNLADGQISQEVLQQFAAELIELLDRDREARKERDEKYEETLARSGLVKPPDGAEFEGASDVVHPMMLEATVDFTSRVVRELLPPEGPVKDKIVGKQTADRVQKADRKKNHMNWQLTKQIKEYRSELEQGISQIMPGGAFYMKWWWDHRLGRPACRAVYVDSILLPYSASSFISADRRAHVMYMTQQEYEEFVDAGVYIELPVLTGSDPEKSETEKAVESIEGKAQTGLNEDGERELDEVQIWRTVEDDQMSQGRRCPYLVTIDRVTMTIVGFYRNWDPEKDQKDGVVEELDLMVEYPFIRFRGAYPLSIYHLIGQLSKSATGALRALLDSGFVNTVPTVLKLKGGLGSDGGQSKEVSPNEINEMDGGLATDDIKKTAMPLPFNPPSSAMFQLLGFLVEAGRGVIRTTFDDLSDSNQNVPVGTTLARYEQGMVVFSSVFGRLHAAQEQSMAILHRLNRYHLKESVLHSDTGEILAKRSDYEGPMDVIPVSDPRIYSDTQRQMRAVTIAQRGTGNPLYDQREIERDFLTQMHVPDEDIDRLLVKVPAPKRMNAVNENLAATMGKPIAAMPEQDHLAHLTVHVHYMMSPLMGSSPIIAPVYLPIMLGHIREHVSLWYVSLFHDMMTQAAGVEITELMDDDEDVMQEFDRLLAAGSGRIMQDIHSRLGQQLPPVIQQAMQLLQQLSPQMPPDPAAQAMMAETQRKTQKDQADTQRDQAKLQLEAQEKERKAAEAAAKQSKEDAEAAHRMKLEEERLQREAEAEEARRKQEAEQALQALADSEEDRRSKEEIAAAQLASKEKINQEDNATALTITQMEIDSAEKTNVSTGTGINPNP